MTPKKAKSDKGVPRNKQKGPVIVPPLRYRDVLQVESSLQEMSMAGVTAAAAELGRRADNRGLLLL